MAGIEEFQIQGEDVWNIEEENLTYLKENIGDLNGILTRLIQHKLISDKERELILDERHHETTEFNKNYKLLMILKSKNWSTVKPTFVQILRDTLNDECARFVEYHSLQSDPSVVKPILLKTEPQQYNLLSERLLTGREINFKWWSEEIQLPNIFLERKFENELLTEKLKNVLLKNENDIIHTNLINPRVVIWGVGGVGKTALAKSFALKYIDDYDLIILIDCSEGKLFKSFKKLANDLLLENEQNHELTISDLACRSFEILSGYRCLIIFDNVECFTGHKGIENVIPKNHNNFHVILTSRSTEWGYEKYIPEFQLQYFDEDEALEFMVKNVKNLKKTDEPKIKELCELLSYLPLSLQIAVSNLNTNKISLDKYIEKIDADDCYETSSTVQFASASHAVSVLDDYEKSIATSLKITLDLIKNHENKTIGEFAVQIVSIFGYISPDDVDSGFFIAIRKRAKGFLTKLKNHLLSSHEREEVEQRELNMIKLELDEATDLLQFYSIISKSNNRGPAYKLNIPRIFQKFLRHTLWEKKNEILRQIFNSKGYLKYKLIPFAFFADEELQKEFPKLKAELIHKLDLKMLLRKGRFQEAVALSRLIKESIKSLVSVYNYALCLKYNNDIWAARRTLQELLNSTTKYGGTIHIDVHHSEVSRILEPNEEISFDQIAWQLLLIYFETEDNTMARKMFSTISSISISYCSVNSSVISLLLQCLKKLKLTQCKILNCSSNSFSDLAPRSVLQDLQLFSNTFVDENGEELSSIDLSHVYSSQQLIFNLNQLKINCSIPFASSSQITRLSLPLEDLEFVTSLHLHECDIVAPVTGEYWSAFNRMTPEELTLRNVKFLSTEKYPITYKSLNYYFFDFHQLKRLDLTGSEISIDLSDPLILDEVSLDSTKIVDWEAAKWTIDTLTLRNIICREKISLKVRDFRIYSCLFNTFVLPVSMQNLTMWECTLVDFSLLPVDKLQLLSNLEKFDFNRNKIIHTKDKKQNNAKFFPFRLSNYKDWTIHHCDISSTSFNGVLIRDDNLQDDAFHQCQSVDLNLCFYKSSRAKLYNKYDLDDPASTYNFALSMKHEGELQFSKLMFEILFREISSDEDGVWIHKQKELAYCSLSDAEALWNKYMDESGKIVQLQKEIILEMVAGQLFLFHFNEMEIPKSSIQFPDSEIFILPIASLREVLHCLNLLSDLNYFLKYNESGKFIYLKLNDRTPTKHTITKGNHMHMFNCTVDENTTFPQDLQQLTLEQIKIFKSLLPNSIISNIFENSAFQKLTLNDIAIDMSQTLTIPEVHFIRVDVLNWENANWKVKHLILEETDFIKKNKLALEELTVWHSSIDTSALPQTITKLHINYSKIRPVVKFSPLAIKIEGRLIDWILNCAIFEDLDGNFLPQLDISYSITLFASALEKLIVICSDDADHQCTKLSVAIDCLVSIPFLHLHDCDLILNSTLYLMPEELVLRNVKIFAEIRNQRKSVRMSANDFIDFSELRKLTLEGMAIDLSDDLTVNEVILISVKIFDWSTAKWTIQKLTLENISLLEETKMIVNELMITGSESKVDVSCLSNLNIKNLKLRYCKMVNIKFPGILGANKNAQLNLQELTLDQVIFQQTSEKDFDISSLIHPELKTLNWNNLSNMPISIDQLNGVDALDLRGCKIIQSSNISIAPKYLTLIHVGILDDFNAGKTTDLINAIVDFKNLQKLCLKGMSLDMDQCINVDEVVLFGTKVSNFNWQIGKLIRKPLDSFKDTKFQLPFPTFEESEKFKKIRVHPPDETGHKDSDFPLSVVIILKIKKVLENYTELKHDWEMVPVALRLTGKSKGVLECHEGNFGSLIFKTLQFWLQEKGSEKATFKALVKVIEKEVGHKLAAEELRKNKEKIRIAEQSCE